MKNKIFELILNKYLENNECCCLTTTELYENFEDIKEIKQFLVELLNENKIDLYYCETNHFVKNFELNIPLDKKIEFITKLPNKYDIEKKKINLFDDINAFIIDEDVLPLSFFPTPNELKKYTKNKDEYGLLPPFTKMLIEGMPRFNFLYFRIDVINRFLYDPRYIVYNYDYHGSISHKEEDSEETIYLKAFGLAYNKHSHENIITAFPWDLSKLSAKHQYHFFAHLFDKQDDFFPEPEYFHNVTGKADEGISIFKALHEEMTLINNMSIILCSETLFKKIFEYTPEKRPEYYHPFIMPTKTMYSNFCRTLYRIFADQLNENSLKIIKDKLNLDISGFDELKSLSRLEHIINEYFGNFAGTKIIKIWKKEIHDERNRLSHSFIDDMYDSDIFKKYSNILYKAYMSIKSIRVAFSHFQTIKNAINNGKIIINDDIENGRIKNYFLH